jgi:hypothetical protein
MPDWVVIMNDTQSFDILIESISGTNVTYRETWSLKNGTDLVSTYHIDVATGQGAWQMQILLISANLQKGDSIFPMFAGSINETLRHKYLGVDMEVNYASTYTQIAPNVKHSLDYYWEKTTGVLCEHQEAYVDQTSGDIVMFYSYEIVDSNIWGLRTYPIIVADSNFTLTTLSNSTISALSFNETAKEISFNATGPDGTSGFCNVTIPSNLLWGEFSLYMDGFLLTRNVDYHETFNGTHYIFQIAYQHSTHKIEITSTEVLPEFPLFLILPLLVILTLLAVIVHKRKCLSL